VTPLRKDFLYANLISSPRTAHVTIQQNGAQLAATQKLDQHFSRGGLRSLYKVFIFVVSVTGKIRMKRVILTLRHKNAQFIRVQKGKINSSSHSVFVLQCEKRGNEEI
jgi:hypothetical protein